MASCRKKCDTCGRIWSNTARRNCSNWGRCSGRLKKYEGNESTITIGETMNTEQQQQTEDAKPCEHRKGKMVGFDEDTFEGSWKCRLCGEVFSCKASIVCFDNADKYRNHALEFLQACIGGLKYFQRPDGEWEYKLGETEIAELMANYTLTSDAAARSWREISADELAEIFHATYELLAPQFGYETREETREFNPESPNGKLMIAVCRSILDIEPPSTGERE